MTLEKYKKALVQSIEMNFVHLSDETNNLSLSYRWHFSLVVFHSTLSLVVCLLMQFLVFVTNITAYIWFSFWSLVVLTGVSHKTRLLVSIIKGMLECFLYQFEFTHCTATLSQDCINSCLKNLSSLLWHL